MTRSRRRRLLLSSSALVLVLVAARLAAPSLIERLVNRQLDGLDGYSGSVEDVDLNLWRGAYRVEGIRIFKTDSPVEQPTLAVNALDISIQWPALLDGAIVAELDLHAPVLNFVATPRRPNATQVEASANWDEQLDAVVPLEINRVGIHGGEVHFRNPHTKPEVDLYLKGLQGRLSNLINTRKLSKDLSSELHVSATAMGSGVLKLDGRIDPFAAQPTFDLNVELEKLKLSQLNDFLHAYARVDVEEGTVAMYAELKARDGHLDGHVKPFLEDVRVFAWGEEEEGVLGKTWEAIVGAATKLLENQREDSVASRIPLSGQIAAPGVDGWSTVGSLLRHAFIKALDRGLRDGMES